MSFIGPRQWPDRHVGAILRHDGFDALRKSLDFDIAEPDSMAVVEADSRGVGLGLVGDGEMLHDHIRRVRNLHRLRAIRGGELP